MISQQQLTNLRAKAARAIESVFPVTIEIEGQSIPAARFRGTKEATPEDAGLLAVADISWRIRREVIPEGIEIVPERTKITEEGTTYRVERVHSPNGDPCIVVEAKAL